MRSFSKKALCVLLTALMVLPVIGLLVNALAVPANAEETANTNYGTLNWNPAGSTETYPRGFTDRGSPSVSYQSGVYGKGGDDFAVNIVGKASTSSGIQYNSYVGAPGHEMNAGDTFEISFDVAFSDADALASAHQYYFRVRFGGKDLATMDGHAHGYGISTASSSPRFFPNTLTSKTMEAQKWYNYKVLFTLQNDKTTLLAEFYVDNILLDEMILGKSGGGEISGFSMIDFTNMTADTSLYVDNITFSNYRKDEAAPGAIKALDKDFAAFINNKAKSFNFEENPYITAREFLDKVKGAILLDRTGKAVKDHTPMRYLTLYTASDTTLLNPYTYTNSVLNTYPETVFDMNSDNGCFVQKNPTANMSYIGGIYGKTEADKSLAYTGSGSAVKYTPTVAFGDNKSVGFSFDIAVSAFGGTGNNSFYMQVQVNQEWSSGTIMTGTSGFGIRALDNGALYFGDVYTNTTLSAGKWYNIYLSMNRIEANKLRICMEVDGKIVFFKDLQIRDSAPINTFHGVNLFQATANTLYLDNVTLRHLNPEETLESPSSSNETIASMLDTSAKTFNFASNPRLTAAEFMASANNIVLLDNQGNRVSDDTPMRFLNLHALEYGYPGTQYTYANIPAAYKHYYYNMEATADAAFPDEIWVLNSGAMSGISYPSVDGSDGKVIAISNSAPQVIYKAYQAFGESSEKFDLSFDFSIESQVSGNYKKYIQILYNNIYGANSLGTQDTVHITSGGKLKIFGQDTGVTISPKQWYSLKFEMKLTSDNTKLAVNVYVDGDKVVNGEFALATPAAISVFCGFKIYNNENTFYIDNVETNHYYKSEANAELIKELEAITGNIDLIELPDPLTNENKITLPTVPAGYSISINSSSNESIIDKAGNITRGSKTEKVYLTLTVTNTEIGESLTTNELLVPVYKTYVCPSVTEEDIAAAKAAYEKLKYGVFVHYVPSTVYADGSKWGATDSSGNVLDIDALANNFDAEKFAEDMNAAGAEYVVFTAWHALTYPLFPSMTNERWRDDRGALDKTYSDRDVISDLLDALEPYGISLHLYVHPSEGKDFNSLEQELTGWNDPTNGYATWNAYTNELMYELGERYGDRIDGLWIDAFFVNIPNEETFKTYATANNPKMIMNMNVGLEDKYHIENPMPEHTGADYRAWEFNHQSSLAAVPLTKNQTAIIIGSSWFTDKAQTSPVTVNSAEELFRYLVAQGSISTSGGFLASAGCYPNRPADNLSSIWQPGILEALAGLNAYLSAYEGTVKGTLPGKAYPTHEGSKLSELVYVSTESEDGKTVYIHLLNPTGNTFTLPAPADGSVFSLSSSILNSNGNKTPITLAYDNGTYTVKLPEGVSFDTVDTVIELTRAEATPPPDVSTFIPKVSVSLHSDFIFNIYLPVREDIVKLTLGNEDIDLTLAPRRTIDGNEYYHITKLLNASNAADSFTLKVSIELSDERVVSGNFTMGIIKYAKLILSAENSSEIEKTLVKDMLSYISAAYTYFNKSDARDVKASIDGIIGENYNELSLPNEDALAVKNVGEELEAHSMDLGTKIAFIFYPKDGYAPESFVFTQDGHRLESEILTDAQEKVYIKVYAYAYGMCSDISYSIEGTDIIGSHNIKTYYEYSKTHLTDVSELVLRLWKYSESAAEYRASVIGN